MLNTNPTLTLQMSLDEFNKMQGRLSTHPFNEVADLILGFRRQVEQQLAQMQQAESASSGASGAPTRLRPVEDARSVE